MQNSNIIEELTAAEMSIAERTAGLSIATLEDANFPKVDLLGALAWVYVKRSEPNLSFKQFMEGNTMKSITLKLGLDEAGDGDGARADAVVADAEGGS